MKKNLRKIKKYDFVKLSEHILFSDKSASACAGRSAFSPRNYRSVEYTRMFTQNYLPAQADAEILKFLSVKRFGNNKIVLLYLFGSVARGTAHKESDIDIGVLFDNKIKKGEYLRLEGRIIEFFSNLYPRKEINVVNFNISSPLLKQAAVLEGKLLYKRSDDDRIFFEINTLREYEEYSHLSKIYNKFLNVKLKAL